MVETTLNQSWGLIWWLVVLTGCAKKPCKPDFAQDDNVHCVLASLLCDGKYVLAKKNQSLLCNYTPSIKTLIKNTVCVDLSPHNKGSTTSKTALNIRRIVTASASVNLQF